jgi:hypothetical protein
MMAIGWLLNLNRYGAKTLRCKLWARARQARGEINLFVRKTCEMMYFNIKYLCFTLPIGHFWIWTVAKRQGRLVIIVECEVEGASWRLCSVHSLPKVAAM